ncbi:hypothetical protein [Aliivibrio kagoshimensis]|jgi:hypothetical protein|uniref:hypothetical protein n=1 Tax=Aliivibrio kagoshimensis TaxID=2910230 RepID=UPI003D09FB43
MLADTLARVDKLRKKAMADPEFIQSAKDHEHALIQPPSSPTPPPKKKKSKKKLADIYQESNFGTDPTGTQH